jgi:hypothetical protein
VIGVTVIGASTVALPTIAYLVLTNGRNHRSTGPSRGCRCTTRVMAVLFLVFAFSLLGEGLGGLF